MTSEYPKFTAIRRPPKNLNDNDILLFAHEFSKNIKPTKVLFLKNVDILSASIFNRYKLKFYQKDTHLHYLPVKDKLRRLKLLLKDSTEIPKAIWITDEYSNGYFHWLTDALTRLVVCEELIDSHTIVLPKHYEKDDFIRQSLQIFNLNVKYFDTLERVHVLELLLPSHTAPTGNYNKSIINKLRDRFYTQINKGPFIKIYISRQKASKRKITNEQELIPVLKVYDYEIHCFEDYNFQQQVTLMQRTSHLIGLHGAGLTNMLFMPKNGKILELRNGRDAHNNCFFSLASDLEHDYYYLLNDGDSYDTHRVNITVNPKEFTQALQNMLL